MKDGVFPEETAPLQMSFRGMAIGEPLLAPRMRAKIIVES
jgi:hypothetical protein